MPRRRNTANIIITAAIFIIMEVAAIAMLRSSSALSDAWFNRISHKCMGFIWSGSTRVSNYFTLKKENDKLTMQNLELQARNLRLEEILRDNISEETKIKPTLGFAYIHAMVIKMSDNTPRNYFVLNKGYLDGIESHCGVISPDGVIGIIEAVDKHYCYGLSLLNTNISISARVGKSGDTGPLNWDGIHKDRAILSGLALHAETSPGDTIWTSGYSSLFPPEIPIGIAGEARIINGTSTEVPVQLFQNFNAVRFVTVVKNIGANEINSLEKLEEAENE